MDNDRMSNFMAGPIPPPEEEEIPPEEKNALRIAQGDWAIIRKGKRNRPPTVRRFKREVTARAAWKRLDVREGWGALVDPDGKTMARQSGPFGVRKRW